MPAKKVKSKKSEVRSKVSKTTAATVKKPAKAKKADKKSKVVEKRISSKNNFKKILGPIAQYEKQIVLLFVLLGLAGLLYLFSKWFIVALVDKVPVTRAQFYQELDKRYGKQIKEQLVVQQLVLNEAKKRGVTISQQEIEAEYKKVQDQVGADMLGNLLAQQNITDKDFRNQLKLQLLVRKMFGQGINITDADIDKYLKDNQATQSAQTIDDKQKQQIRDQLTNQKVSQNFQSWLQQAQSSSRVIKF